MDVHLAGGQDAQQPIEAVEARGVEGLAHGHGGDLAAILLAVAREAFLPAEFLRALLQGFTTLADDGMLRVLNGVTSLEELARVVDLTDRM